MELIQIDTVNLSFTEEGYHRYNDTLPKDLLLLDTETGVVYFRDLVPRYDSNGKVMVIPREQLPDIIKRARAQFYAVSTAVAAEKQRKYGGPTQV